MSEQILKEDITVSKRDKEYEVVLEGETKDGVFKGEVIVNGDREESYDNVTIDEINSLLDKCELVREGYLLGFIDELDQKEDQDKREITDWNSGYRLNKYCKEICDWA